MPSKSKSQQRFFGMVDAYKKGEMKNASNKIKKAANGMSMNDVKDFAETKHKGLPNKVKENKTMNKKLIRLTESDLHRIVKESVNKILNEIGDTAKGQYMLGRLQGRQMGNGNRQQAINTHNYASRQLGSRTPRNFQTYDAAETANEMGYKDERYPQLSQDMMTNGGTIGNYQANVRNNYLRGVSKF